MAKDSAHQTCQMSRVVLIHLNPLYNKVLLILLGRAQTLCYE